jgi:predicted CopG family antitoxin
MEGLNIPIAILMPFKLKLENCIGEIMKTIAINENNLAFLKRLKKEKRLKSLNDVIEFLIRQYQSLQIKEAPKEAPETKSPDNPFEFAQNNPCPFRTIIKAKSGGFYVLCAETKKIPLEACITRQKRYLQFNKKCKPIGLKPKPKPQSKPMKTRIYRDEFESAYYPDYTDSDAYFRDDWGLEY